MNSPVTVIGAGSWGTALANLLAEKGFSVNLWARDEALVKEIAKIRENRTYLPGVRLSERISPSDRLDEALDESSFVVAAVPSHGLRPVFEKAAPFIKKDSIIVSAAKGIEEDTRQTACSILEGILGKDSGERIVALSGPSFAKEVSQKLPAAVCAASRSMESATIAQSKFSTHYFRVYTNTDVLGVELGGALKNVIAIASGISDGLGLGHNARAALITRALAEMTRLGTKLGADERTFSGLSGLGDLVLTCTGPLSRNYTVGLEIGKGKKLDEVISGMKMVAEGVKTSRAIKALCASNGVEMPISTSVFEVLHMNKPPKEAVLELMNRELKKEGF